MTIRVGDHGLALSAMCPSGFVEIDGKRIDARSADDFIEAGSSVVVVRGDPTGYVVRKLTPGQPHPHLPDHGRMIRKADFQQNRDETAMASLQERETTRERLRQGLRKGLVSWGIGGGIVGLAIGGVVRCFGVGGDSNAATFYLLGGSCIAGAMTGMVLLALCLCLAADE